MSDDQKQQTEETGEDNLNVVDVLNDFNITKGSSEEPQEEATQPEESNVETQEESNVSTEGWLIENKFKDDDEGRANLAKSYRELQSKSDKEKGELGKKADQFNRLEKLDTLLDELVALKEDMKLAQ